MSKISTGVAKKLIINFKNNQAQRLDNEETRAVWFSRSAIEEILNTDVRGKRPSGIRFYFAAYLEKDSSRTYPRYEDENNKMTLVMVPTTDYDSDGNRRDHYYRSKEFLPYDLLESPGEPPTDKEAKDFLEGNDGQICPPPPLNELLP